MSPSRCNVRRRGFFSRQWTRPHNDAPNTTSMRSVRIFRVAFFGSLLYTSVRIGLAIRSGVNVSLHFRIRPPLKTDGFSTHIRVSVVPRSYFPSRSATRARGSSIALIRAASFWRRACLGGWGLPRITDREGMGNRRDLIATASDAPAPDFRYER